MWGRLGLEAPGTRLTGREAVLWKEGRAWRWASRPRSWGGAEGEIWPGTSQCVGKEVQRRHQAASSLPPPTPTPPAPHLLFFLVKALLSTCTAEGWRRRLCGPLLAPVKSPSKTDGGSIHMCTRPIAAGHPLAVSHTWHGSGCPQDVMGSQGKRNDF